MMLYKRRFLLTQCQGRRCRFKLRYETLELELIQRIKRTCSKHTSRLMIAGASPLTQKVMV
jgi:hypothetical protein